MKNTGNPKMKNLKSLKELFSSYYIHVLEKSFSNIWVILSSNNILSKIFFHGFLDGKQPKILILHFGDSQTEFFYYFLIVYFFKYDVII